MRLHRARRVRPAGWAPPWSAGASPLVVAVVSGLAVVAAAAVGSGVVHAHSGLAAASPGPDTVVGGEITLVELFYGDLITEFDATVTYEPDGSVLEAEAVMTSEITAEIRLAAPIAEVGVYRVDHRVLSIDGDVVESDYRFTYEPAAPDPVLVFLPEADDAGGLAWWGWLIIGLGAAVIVVLAVRLIRALRAARSSSP